MSASYFVLDLRWVVPDATGSDVTYMMAGGTHGHEFGQYPFARQELPSG